MHIAKTALSDPRALGPARAQAHAAVQILTRAARANLPAVPDDSHSNIGWDADLAMFVTHPLGPGAPMVGLRLTPLTLAVVTGGAVTAELRLANATPAAAMAWTDARLTGAGLAPATAANIPYDLPPEVAAVATFRDVPGLAALAAWFDLAAHSLGTFAAALPGDLAPGPSPVRCWPHHFDIATYVGLGAGDPETAPGIGVGLSPGDDSYGEPYFYVNPWPHLDAAGLPDPVAQGHWHTQGFVGLIATGSEILTRDDVATGTRQFLRDAFDTGRRALGV